MKVTRLLLVPILILSVVGLASAQEKKRRLLVIGQSKGYQHESVSTAMVTLYKPGTKLGRVGDDLPDRLLGDHQEAAQVRGQEPQ